MCPQGVFTNAMSAAPWSREAAGVADGDGSSVRWSLGDAKQMGQDTTSACSIFLAVYGFVDSALASLLGEEQLKLWHDADGERLRQIETI